MFVAVRLFYILKEWICVCLYIKRMCQSLYSVMHGQTWLFCSAMHGWTWLICSDVHGRQNNKHYSSSRARPLYLYAATPTKHVSWTNMSQNFQLMSKGIYSVLHVHS